jgi:hypothetical protein
MVSNGQLPSEALGYIEGHRIRKDLVPQTQAMHNAALRDGVNLTITQGYRSYAEQVAIFNARYDPKATGTGPYNDVRWWNGVRYVRMRGAAAAVPGSSNHGLGQAIDYDLGYPGSLAWLTKNGPRFGWIRPSWTFKPGMIEPWHWEGAFVLVSNPGPSLPSVPSIPTTPTIPDISPKEDEEDMPVIISSPTHGKALLSGSRLTGLGDQSSVDGLSAAGIKTAPVSDADFLRFVSTSTDTWVLFANPGGFAVWAGGRAIGLGSEQLANDFIAKGATRLNISPEDFQRFTTN